MRTVVWSQLIEPGDCGGGPAHRRSWCGCPRCEAVLAGPRTLPDSPPRELMEGRRRWLPRLRARAVATPSQRPRRTGVRLVTRSDPSGRASSTTSTSTRRCACGCAATSLRSVGSTLPSRSSARGPPPRYGDHVALELSAELAGGGIAGGVGRRLRHRRRRAPCGAGRRRTHRRAARGRRRPRVPGRDTRSSSTHRRARGGGERGAVRIRAHEVAVPAAQPADRRALGGHGGRRGRLAQRLAQHAGHAAALSRGRSAPCRVRSPLRPPRAPTACSASSARSASRALTTCASCSG